MKMNNTEEGDHAGIGVTLTAGPPQSIDRALASAAGRGRLTCRPNHRGLILDGSTGVVPADMRPYVVRRKRKQ